MRDFTNLKNKEIKQQTQIKYEIAKKLGKLQTSTVPFGKNQICYLQEKEKKKKKKKKKKEKEKKKRKRKTFEDQRVVQIQQALPLKRNSPGDPIKSKIISIKMKEMKRNERKK